MTPNFRPRKLDLSTWVEKKSVLLLGPRQTGKSTLLAHSFVDARQINLLEADTFREFSARPELLRERHPPDQKVIIIDEIQKLPELLDEAQLMLDRDRSLRMVITGSSARKLKRGRANLLGGRMLPFSLHPLTQQELGFKALDRHLEVGGLPAIFDSSIPDDELKAYIGTYLQEEIQAEGIARSLPQFSRFLEVMGLCNGEQINYSQIGSDAQVKARTVHDYVQVLIDTLVGYSLVPFRKTRKRKAVAAQKFYFFDRGVARVLARESTLNAGTPAYGKALEHHLLLELQAWKSYSRHDAPLGYWRSQTKFEVDFTWGDSVAIEVKAKANVGDRDLAGLRALKEERIFKRFICVALEGSRRRTDDGIEVVPYLEFLREIWGNGLG